MRHHPSCWNKVLAKLGFRRVSRPQKRQAAFRGRLSRIEPLEVRQLLSITVNTLVDEDNGIADGQISLREAIAAAPVNGNIVEFHSSLTGGTIHLNSQLSISQSVTITGPGADKLTIDAQENGRVFHVQTGVVMATISGLTITGGSASQYGGGVFNEGSLQLVNMAVVGNRSAIHGGGVFSNGPYLEINGSTIENNRASWGGGVLGSLAGDEQIYILNSTIANNVADNPAATNGQGGGVRVGVTSASTVTNLGIHNSTISGNRAEAQGGGVHVTGQARANFRNVTVVQNRADGYAGGIYNESVPLLMRNTILAGNTAGDAARADGSGSFTGQFGITSRYNFIGVDHSSFQLSTANANQIGSVANPLDPRLSPLTNVGGLTRVHVPLPGSPVIDHGADGDAAGLAGDQRGSGRFVEDDTAPNAPGNTSDVGAVELEARIAVGDFNGDGREDELRYSPVLKSLLVAEKAATGAGWEVGAWGSTTLATTPSPTSPNGVIVGDFNGDGREDVMILVLPSYTWLLGISDGTLFHVTELKTNGNPFSAGWGHVYVGDFDGDGDEELIGKVNGGTNWVLVEYDGVTGVSKSTTVGVPGFAPGTQVFVQDTNRDGRDDFITRANGSSPWMVSLSTGASTGTLQFATAADWNAWIGYGYDNSTSKLDADKAMAKVIEEFAWVYNNVELELYPGLMKGPEATRQTKAGNNWDQAALLEKRLQEIGVGDVKIATGKVRIAANQFGNLANWLGVTTLNAALNVLQTLDSNAIALDANGNNAVTTQLPVVAIEFTHAWVRAYVPTASGMSYVDLDPSWKMKDRANGIPLPADFDNVRTQLGVFDEIAYLALDPEVDRSLPVEYFEDQLVNWLANSAVHRGSSLADVAYDGPILTKTFQRVPTGMGDGVVIVNPGGVVQYEDFAALAANSALTHRVVIRLKKGSSLHWTETLAVPIHSLDAIQISFASSSSAAQNNPNEFALANSSNFYSRLVVGGTVHKWGSSGQAFTSADNVTIEVEHLGPQSLVSGAALNRQFSYSRKPGQIMAVSLDANQHSHQSLAALQSQLLSATAVGDSEAILRQAIDNLVVYAGAKYWADFNRYNRAIEGFTGSVGVQQWVGSGIVTADPTLLLDPVPEGANDYVIEYLPYGIAPANFGVDLPNINHGVYSIVDGLLHKEAWQLIGYNSSALEHSVVEEIISADAVSTMKGLQQAFQRDMGIDGNGNPITSNVDVVQEYTRKQVNGVWEIRHVGNWYSNGTSPVMAGSPANVNITANVQNYLLSTSTGQLKHHANHTNLGNTIHSLLTTGDDEVRILVPLGRTKLDNWVGGVYLVEKPNSMLFAIQADGGPPSSGGYSGGVTTPPPPELKLGNFLNSTWAGDPVSVANGNMFRDEVDFSFPNLGTPLSFARHYDSQSKDDVGLGAGWTFTFGDVLYTESSAPNDLVWLDARGARHTFKWNGSNGFNIPNDLQGTLRYLNQITGTSEQTTTALTGTDKWTEIRFKSVDGTEFHFQRIANYQPFGQGGTWAARLRMQLDANGDGVKVTLNSQFPYHQTIEDVHDSSRRLTWTTIIGGDGNVAFNDIALYNGTSQPVATWRFDMQVLPAAQSSAFSPYRLEKVIGNYSPTALPDDLRITSYSYHPSSLPSKGLMQRITEPDGAWHEYEYFRNSRVFRVKQGDAGQSPSDAAVDVQTFNYNLLKLQTEFTDERGHVETYLHQKNGLLTKQIHADRSQVKSSWGAINTTDEFLMTSTTDERGAIENFTYYGSSDPAFKRGQLKESTSKHYPNQTGVLTRYDYVQSNSSKPHLVSPSTVVVDPNSAIADPASGYYVGQKLTTTHTYHPSGDSLGKLWKTTDARGNVVEYSYYSNSETVYRRGLLKSIKQPSILDPNDPNNVATVTYETIFDYDAAGNITKSTRQTVPIAPAPPVIIAESTFAYDSMGNVVRSVDPTGVVTESIIDALGRLLETGYGDSNVNVNPLDAFTSRYKYDAVGRVRESADPLGRVATYEYDRQGNVVKQVNPDGTAILHAYDSFGLRVATTDPLGRITQFVYDGRNRLIQTIHPDGAVERLRYDGLGNVVASIDALGNVTTFQYDAAGRLVETKLPDPDGPNDEDGDGINLSSPTTTNKYDKLRNLIETIDPEFNVTQFKYDKLGRVVQTQTLKGVNGNRNVATPWVVTGTLQSLTTIDYDAVGNVIKTAAYDVSQYDAAATTTLLADPRAQQTIAANKVQVVSMRYDAFGRPVKTINADGTTTRATYDAAGRVRYQYDEANSVTEFVYDSFGRLERTKLPDPTTGAITSSSPTTIYQYDAVGNRIAATDARGFTTRFEYDAFNRLIAATDPLGGRSRSIYDVAGQLVATVDELGRAAYAKFDDRGRAVLQLSADPDGAGPQLPSATHSRYDVAGRLVEQIDPRGYATEYVYDRLGRLTTERSIVSEVVDDLSVTNPDVFRTDNTSERTPLPNPAAVGGDMTTVDGSDHGWQPYAQWAFPNMPAGKYRIAFTWAQNGNVSQASAGLAINSFAAPPAGHPNKFYGGINQTKRPDDFYRDHAGAVTAWEDVKFGADQYYEISEAQAAAGATLLVQLIGTVGGTLQADAVRIERVVERKFQYDANGNLVKSFDELGRATTHTYDELDRLITETLPDPDGPNNDDGGANLTSPLTTTSYDGYGNVKSVLEYRGGGANQRTTAYEYDARNRRLAEIVDAGSDGSNGVPNYLNQKTVYEYDAVGNLAYKREYAETAGSFDLLRTTSYKHDKLGRLTRETLNTDGNDASAAPTEQITVTTYDAAGNVQTRTETAEVAGAPPR